MLPSRHSWGSPYTAVYIGQFLFLGVQLPFIPGWLDQVGFTPEEIGGLLGMALVLRLMFTPLIALRAERAPDRRFPLQAAALSLCLAAALLLLPIGKPAVAIVMVGLLFSFGLLVPLTDSTALRADRRGVLNYGEARGIGSFSFIVASLVGGVIITTYGDNVVVVLMALAGVFTVFATRRLPKEPYKAAESAPSPSFRLAAKLFRSRSFLLMLITSGLVQGAHATYYAFSELHWSGLGYSSALIGVLWSFGVVCEIILLLKMRPLVARLGASRLLLVGAVGAVIRWPLTGLSPALGVLALLQAMHAMTFACTYIGTMEFIDRAVPEQYRTTAITLMSTFGVGAMTGVATIFAGRLFEPDAPLPAYLLMGAMGALATVTAVWLVRRWDGGLLGAVPSEPA